MAFALARAVGYAAGIAPGLLTATRLEMLFMEAGLSHFSHDRAPASSGMPKTRLW